MWKTIKYPTLCHSPLCYEWGVLKWWLVLNSQILENGPGKRKSVSSERIPNQKKESKVSRFGPNMVQQSRIISIHNLVAIHIRHRKESSLHYPDRQKSVQKLHYECSEPSKPWEFWGFDQRNCQSIWDLQFLLYFGYRLWTDKVLRLMIQPPPYPPTIEMTLTLSYWSFSVRSASVWLYAKMTVFDSVNPPLLDLNLKWQR